MIARQEGSTLVAELVALAIIGIALTLFVGGLSTMSLSVGIVEQRTSAENYARQQMEIVKSAPYQPNPTTMPYPTVQIRCPTGQPACTPIYSTEIRVTYWHTDTETFSEAYPAPDANLQRIQVKVYSQMRPGQPIFTLEDLKYKVGQP